jgi:hypothetical protein
MGMKAAVGWPAPAAGIALPFCTVTISRGSTAVRVLNCANRVNGRDADGWLRNSDLRLVPVTGIIEMSA